MADGDQEWQAGGRTPRWRVGMLAGGALLAGYGVAIVWRPQILIWTVAGALIALGALFVISALLARGRR